MPTQTQSQKEWAFEDLYNVLMESIEPELCTYNLGIIDDIYTDEKEKERTERFAHYARCLELFWDALKELIDLTKTDLKEFETEFISILKERFSTEEKTGLSDLEKSISES